MNKQLIFAIFAGAILLAMVRQWRTPLACPLPALTRTVPLAGNK